MAEDQLRTLIDGIRTRLQAELESHLSGLVDQHERTLHDTRRFVEADAEQKWTAKLEEERAGWGTRLQSEIASAREDAARSMAEELTRVRLEAEQSAAEAAAQARRELEHAVAAEHTRAQADLERAQGERERAQAELERAHADLERAVADRERAHAEREHIQAELARAHDEVERAQSELQRAQAEMATASEERGRTHDDLRRAQEVLQRSQDECQRAQEAVQRSQNEFQHAQDALQRSTADLETARNDLQRTKEELQRTTEDLERTRGELQRIGDEFQTAQMQLAIARTQTAEIRADSDRALADARAAFEAERQMTAANAVEPIAASSPSALLDAVRAIDEAESLSEALAAAVRGAALECPRVALFIVNGSTLQEWPVAGVPSIEAGPLSATGHEAGVIADALRAGQAESIDGTNGRTAPAFAGLAPGRRAIAVPFVLGGEPVAVLYADEGADGEPLASWRDTVQILGRHASAFLAYLTTVRTAQALNLISGSPLAPAVDAGDDDAHGARRYARLLVSEIKMYNDGAVRTGREHRDLLQRLKPEIDRARHLYEERIAPSHARDLYFQQELVQTLADGDHSLLG